MTEHEHLSIEILADHAEGLLGDADSTSVAEHLASCADCRAEADLLVSVGTLLAADDPGPMPAHFAARIDAALADLAAAEPVTPKRSTAIALGEGATVIDLASRRRFTPAARVTSVAASLVLLIGGVALGMQALDTTDAGDPNDIGAIEQLQPTPSSSQSRYLAYALSAQDKPKGKDVRKRKDGSIEDKRTGAVFLKSGKVLFPDGVVVVPKDNGEAEVRTFDVQSGKTRNRFTFRPPSSPEQTPAVSPAPAATPAAENPPKATPQPTPTPEATPQPTPQATAEVPAAPEAYVTASGETYTTDNFAAKVQNLLRAAGHTIESADGTSTGKAPSSTAPADVAAKVKRCAAQLGLTADLLAGDAGIWRGESATIVVTRNGSEARQAVGYVVYGDCSKETPASQTDVQWTMRVDFPSAQEPNPSVTNNTTNTVTPSIKASRGSSVVGTAANGASSSSEQ